MKFYWFGDSWLAGEELQLTVPADQRKNYTFAKIVSDHYQVDCVNLGENGLSPDIFPLRFSQIVNRLQPGDTVFFCLSSSHRTILLDDSGHERQIMPDYNTNSNRHPYAKEWYKYFDTKHQRIYNFDRTVDLLYLWCQSLGVRCCFLNLFTTEPEELMNIVPESAWIIPRDQCAAQSILHTVDNDLGMLVVDDNPRLLTVDWERQKELLERYVRPGVMHPNVAGHAKIAEDLIARLQDQI
jgi:hypothetical protein